MAFVDDSTVSAGGSTGGSTDSNTGGISRRSVLRTGAIAGAWSVPLVQVVAAAPAHATSGSAALSFTQQSGAVAGTSAVSLSIKIKNTGGQPTTNLQVTVEVTAPNGSVTVSLPAGSGWSVKSQGRSFTFTATSQLSPSAETPLLNPTFTLNQTGGFTASVAATATNAPSVSTSISVAR